MSCHIWICTLRPISIEFSNKTLPVVSQTHILSCAFCARVKTLMALETVFQSKFRTVC